MALFRGIQEYIARDVNNIARVESPQGHPILYNYHNYIESITDWLVINTTDAVGRPPLRLFVVAIMEATLFHLINGKKILHYNI